MANTKWVCGWGTAIDTTTQTITDYIEDITFRYVIYPTMPASAVRLHFSNLYGTETVNVDKVFVATEKASKYMAFPEKCIVCGNPVREEITKADTALANEELGWKAERSLDDTLASAWAWEKHVRGL